MFTLQDHTFSVCAYGESPFLEECIDSVLAQDQTTNVILCTSTPNDLIHGLADKYSIELFVNPKKEGIASDWNFAIDSAHAKLVTIAHQDDFYCSDYSQTMLDSVNSCIQREDTPLIFFSDYGELRDGRFVDDTSVLKVKRKLLHSTSRRGYATTRRQKRSILRFGNAISCPSVTYNKNCLPQPIFDTKMKNALDWEEWEKLSNIDGCFCYSPKILMYHRIHEESETSKNISENIRAQEDLLMLEKFWPKPIASAIEYFYSSAEKKNEL